MTWDGATWTIRRVHVEAFRSIVSATIELGDVTVLVGRNGAGKSNLLDAMQFLADATELGLAAAFDLRQNTGRVSYAGSFATSDGPPSFDGTLRIGCELEGPKGSMAYGFGVKATPGQPFQVQEEWLREGDQPVAEISGGRFIGGSAGGSQDLPTDRLVLPALYRAPFESLKGLRVFSPRPELIRVPRESQDDEVLHRNAMNLNACWSRLYSTDRALAERVTALLRQVLPALRRLEPVEVGGYFALRANIESRPGSSSPVDGAGLSDGTLRALALLVATYQPRPKLLTAFEEPESFVHPFAAERLVEAILGAPQRGQILFTTQSASLLDASAVRPEMLRVVEYAAGMTRVGPVASEQLEEVRAHLVSPGELLLDGTLRMGVPTETRVGPRAA